MRSQAIGEVNVQHDNIFEIGNNQLNHSARMEEGTHDNVQRRRAPRQHFVNGLTRQNVHPQNIGLGVDENDPSSRFQRVQQGFEALNGLVTAYMESFTCPPQRVLGNMIDDLIRTNNLLTNSDLNQSP